MGASESTPTTNGTNQEEERKQESGEGSMGRFKTAAIASIAVAGVAALAISKMHSPCSYKMKTDGSCSDNHVSSDEVRGPGGFGGILLDNSGNWVRGFMGFSKEISDNIASEIHGIYHGLLLLDKLGFKESTLQSDCQPAIEWMTNENLKKPGPRKQGILGCWDIITEGRLLVRKNNITVEYIEEDYNKCADKLAHMAVKNQVPYMEIMDCPYQLDHLLEAES